MTTREHVAQLRNLQVALEIGTQAGAKGFASAATNRAKASFAGRACQPWVSPSTAGVECASERQ